MSKVSILPTRLPDGEFAQLVQAAKDQHNLSDIIGRHTQLKKRGGHEQVGLCPFHNERSPSFEVNDAKGAYHCHGCGRSGDAITFLMECEGMTFRAAYEALAGDIFPTVSEEERVRRKAEDEQKRVDRIALAKSIWAVSVPPVGTPAEVYASARGITMDLPEMVRFAMIPRYRNHDTGEVGRDHPAMVCGLQDGSDDVVGVQAIFLQDGGRSKYTRRRPDGTAAKAKLTYGALAGSTLRLGPIAPSIVLCEGPEDGLTLAQAMPQRSVWVTCGTAGLSQVKFPRAVQSVILAGDNNDAGRAAIAKAKAIYASEGLSVQEVYPKRDFKDWNDQLRGVRCP